MAIEKQINLLKRGDLSTNEFQTILNTIHSTLPLSETESLELSTLLLQHVLPQTYTFMDEYIQTITCDLLCSKVALLQMIRIIKDDNGNENMKGKYICIDLFCRCVNNIEKLVENFTQYQGTDYDTWKNLLSVKIIDIFGYINIWMLNHANSTEEITINREKIKKSEETYLFKLTSALIGRISTLKKFEALNCVRQIFSYFFSLKPKDLLIIVLNIWDEWKLLYAVENEIKIKHARQLKESRKNALLGMLNAINNAVSIDTLVLYFSLIADFDDDLAEFNDVVMTRLTDLKVEMTFLWLKYSENVNMEYLYEKLKKFGNKNYIINTPVNDQRNLMNHILALLYFLDDTKITEISKRDVFLEVISARLESSSTTLRQMGMFIGDLVYQKCNGKYLFHMKEYSKERDELLENLYQLRTTIDQSSPCENVQEVIGSILEKLHKKETEDKFNKGENQIQDASPIMIEIGYNSDEEDSDLDDHTVGKKPSVAKPVFLKDLLYYMTSDSQKDTSTYEKRGIAFSIGIEMVRLKKNSQEIKYYCTKLIDAGLDIDSIGFPSNKTADEDDIHEAVESWRVSFLVALCTSVSDLAFKYLIEGFLSNDWSFMLRIQVLTVLGLSCRELSGKDDTFVWGKNKSLDLPMLPQHSHQAFINLDTEYQRNKIQDLDQEQKEQKLVEALESADISSGNVVYRSRNLDIKNKSSEIAINQTKRTTFINKSLPKIFFTMVSVWQKINTLTHGRGFVAGSFSDQFNSHFLDILAIIYTCGVPNCIELQEMSLELILCICGALQIVQESSREEFPVRLFQSCINSIRSLLAENERVLSVLKTTANVQLSTLTELYSQVLSNSPPVDRTSGDISTALLHQLQNLSSLF
ncbi:hypothetical protein CANINC_000743 [Pichia inconspicua]|uniref:Telomere length regulation protein conserved domain-containing protein n=1 Tax=Pichia inconspicua TaxID=52247 RepID=A0A4T0X5C9_9ASCO|nr:hypothetical protein CANINC_000743 [[Candida] inconspicua]